MTRKFLMAEALEGPAEALDFQSDSIEYDMDKFSAGGFRPTEVPVDITPRELAIRKGLRLIKTATCKADLYTIASLWADRGVNIQVQDMDHQILALEATWEQRNARLAREAKLKVIAEARRAKANRQAQYDRLYNDLFARATEAGATTMAIVAGQGDIVIAVGGMNKKHWSASNAKVMLAATETRLNGGRLEFVV